MTYSELRDSVLSLAYPEGFADNLLDQKNRFFLSGMIDLQKRIPCISKNHLTVIPYSTAIQNRGANQVASVFGELVEIRIIDQNNPCHYVIYQPVALSKLESLQRSFCNCPTGTYPAVVTAAETPATDPELWNYLLGENPPELVQTMTRFPTFGFYAIERDRTFIYPAIGEHMTIAMRWNGIRRSYDDDTIIIDDFDLTDLLMQWVLYQSALFDVGCAKDEKELRKQEYASAAAERRAECMKRRNPRAKRVRAADESIIGWYSQCFNCTESVPLSDITLLGADPDGTPLITDNGTLLQPD